MSDKPVIILDGLAATTITRLSQAAGITPAQLLKEALHMWVDKEAAESSQHCLTCAYCKHAPATHLLVADLRFNLKRITDLVCLPCGARNVKDARSIAVSASSVWLFRLTESTDTLERVTNEHRRAPHQADS